ncbi:MAG: Rpn family recombination-promoting nuclease/putative transposase [Planctomycetota bacterium]
MFLPHVRRRGAGGAMFRLALPAPLVRAIDWATLRALPTEVVDAELAEHCLDLPFAARLWRPRRRLLLVAEHKSVDDPDLALQILRYALCCCGAGATNTWANSGCRP